MTRRKLVRIGCVTGLLALCVVAGVMLHARSRRQTAVALVEAGLWKQAGRELRYYLRFYPTDHDARLRLAEALVKDEQRPVADATRDALEELAAIPDSSELADRALLQRGRLRLLIEHQPVRAERVLRRAVEKNAELLEAWYVLWKLYDLTGRSHLAEPIFWNVYELSPEEQKAGRLREWYMSQFYPATANPSLDRNMGLLEEGAYPTPKTEVERFIHFRNREPDEPLGYAAIARWFLLEGDPKQAMELLREGMTKAPHATTDAFFLATLVHALFDLGEFEEAQQYFSKWPEPHTGYEYWKWRAMLADDVQRDNAAAIEAYDQALAQWPGEADWRTRVRKANALARDRQHEAAEKVRKQAQQIESLMEPEVHQRVRNALGYLRNPAELETVASFYESLQRPREAEAWRREVEKLLEEAGLNSSTPSSSPETAFAP